MIRPATPADAGPLAAIYNHYITETVVTFEESPVTPEEMARRLGLTTDAGFPWLVWDEAGRVLGYAYAGPWKTRSAYRFAAEATVYLDPAATGRGLGTQLYTALLTRLVSMGLHTVIGGIALPNPASIALHTRLGFRPAAHFHEVGWKFGRWIDVGYWELKLPAPSANPPAGV
jgi:L-amino acid N-acyltransferase YncA